jgi:hypothetical protein
VLDELFLAALARYPTTEERQELAGKLSEQNRRAAVEDLLWLLVNHREFLFQH